MDIIEELYSNLVVHKNDLDILTNDTNNSNNTFEVQLEIMQRIVRLGV